MGWSYGRVSQHAHESLETTRTPTHHFAQGNPIPSVATALNASHVHPYNLVKTASGKRVALCGLLKKDDLGLTAAWIDVLSDLSDVVPAQVAKPTKPQRTTSHTQATHTVTLPMPLRHRRSCLCWPS